MNKKINLILPKKQFQIQRVGIYARVSTTDKEQLDSLVAQISALTRLTSHYSNWKFVDIYIDIASGKTKSSRKEFSRMLEDIKKEDIDIIFTKSVSRFGRDTVDALKALKVIKQASARIIFEQENLDSQEDDTDMTISIMESLAQSENEQRSENIKCGLKQRAAQGTSKLYNRKCYGYDHDENGELIINFQHIKIVKKISIGTQMEKVS
ncbi:recombinase family protein [uncultured Anaerococcus sp.]|uniref:recombinase family protein n=1 Tax=uncultured Anaerococcus sp. TaxID=293428 RepID=UPI0025D3A426|nr:recombinase family protein [uncultured Anaerococcus sp.]